jgi:hypothetical protein
VTDFACTWSARVDETIATDPLYLAPARDPREAQRPPAAEDSLDDVVTRPADHPRYDWYDTARIPLEIGHPDREATIFHLRRSGGVARWPVDH